MADLTATTAARYSVYVPEPLTRLNLGERQKRDGTHSSKFGYAGVSIKTDEGLFADISGKTCIQAQDGFHLQAKEENHLVEESIVMAAGKSALLGAENVITLVAGAGQEPSYIADHGSSIDVAPYRGLSLHYRVEEVQNGLFEFFRGERERDEPPQESKQRAFARGAFFKSEGLFNAAPPGTGWKLGLNPFTDEGSNLTSQKGAKEKETEAKLQGGFERVVEDSWQALYGAPPTFVLGQDDKVAPQALFGDLNKVRGVPGDSPNLQAVIADATTGEHTEKQLRYGFSDYFSRLDPYALTDPESIEGAGHLVTARRTLVKAQNAVVRMKRTLDVAHKIGGLLGDNGVVRLIMNTWGMVDDATTAIKATWEGITGLADLGGEFTDTGSSGFGSWGSDIGEQTSTWGGSADQATIRSVAYDPDKPFEGTTLTLVCDDDVTYTTPPLPTATAAKITGTGSMGWTFEDGRVSVQIDDGPKQEVDLAVVAPRRPTVTGDFGDVTKLAGQKLTGAVDGSPWSVTFPKETSSAAAVRAAFTSAPPDLDVTVAGTTLTLASRRFGPGASIQVEDSGAARALGLPTTLVSGASLAALQAALQSRVGGVALGSKGEITITSPTRGSGSKIRLDGDGTLLANLGLGTTSADGTSALEKLTPADVVALIEQAKSTDGKLATASLTASVDGQQVVCTSNKKGEGSKITASGDLATKLGFVGDATENDLSDEITVAKKRLDSFADLSDHLTDLPDNLSGLLAPVVTHLQAAGDAVSAVVDLVQTISGFAGFDAPETEGAIGLVAKSGISLGTPDRIVGSGSKGIVFIADGSSGAPNHAKFAKLEEVLARVSEGDIAEAGRKAAGLDDPDPDEKPLGFRVYSGSTADLVARDTASVLALGRAKPGADVVGAGVARVAASYAVEIAAQEKVTIGAREKLSGRVEVLGSTIALGYGAADAKENVFGPVDRGDTKGWPVDWQSGTDPAKKHQQTEMVMVHANAQASIVVGKYLIHVRSNSDAVVKAAQAEVEEAEREAQTLEQRKQDLTAAIDRLGTLARPTTRSRQRLTAQRQELADVEARLLGAADRKQVARARKEATVSGVVIGLRDEARSSSMTSFVQDGKPSIFVGEKEVTVTTKTNEKTGARITLNDDGVTIEVGDKSGVVVKEGEILLKAGDNKAKLSGSAWDFSVNQVAFGNAQRITLG